MSNRFRGFREWTKRFSFKAKELFPSGAGLLARFTNNKFYASIYGEDRQPLSPQVEMEACAKLFKIDGYIAAGVMLNQDLLVGGGIKFSSGNKVLDGKVNAFLDKIGFNQDLMEIAEHFFVAGNVYYELGKAKDIDKWGGIKVIPYPEKVYIDVDEEGNIVNYIQRIDGPITDIRGVTSYKVRMPYGGFETVMGILLDKEKITHIRYGVGEMGIYGRSPFASATNESFITEEISRALAVIARYKAIPKKVIMAKEPDGQPISNQETIQELTAELDATKDSENYITNYELAVETLFDGGDADLRGLVDTLQFQSRKMTVPLAPNYLLHPETSTYAESREGRIAFFLRVMNNRNIIAKGLAPMFAEILRLFGHPNLEYVLIFEDLDPMSVSHKKEESIMLWEAGIMTMDQVLETHGLEPSPVYGAYHQFEVMSGIVTPPSHGGEFEPEEEPTGPEEPEEVEGEEEEEM